MFKRRKYFHFKVELKNSQAKQNLLHLGECTMITGSYSITAKINHESIEKIQSDLLKKASDELGLNEDDFFVSQLSRIG